MDRLEVTPERINLLKNLSNPETREKFLDAMQPMETPLFSKLGTVCTAKQHIWEIDKV